MDREIECLNVLMPVLRGNLRRNRASTCLEYCGPKRGLVEGNPALLTKVHGKSIQILLRRWVWIIHKGSLPRKHYVIMICGNHSCHNIDHMQVSASHHRYRKNFAIVNFDFPREKVLLIRYFQGLMPATLLSRWFHVPCFIINKIWNNKIFTEYSVPSVYRPPDQWVRRAELYCSKSPHYHYLGLKNYKKAKKAIASSNLAPRTKSFLHKYINGDSFHNIAIQNKMHPSSVRETIIRAFIHLYKNSNSSNMGWFLIILKGKYHLSDYNFH